MQRELRVMTIGMACFLSGCLGGDGGGESGGGKQGSSNHRPTITGVQSPSVVPGEAYEFTPTVTDLDGDVLEFTITRKPSWASFDRATGRLVGTPDMGDVGPYTNITISVADRHASAVLRSFGR